MRWTDKGPAPGCLAERRRELARLERETGRAPTPEDWAPLDCGQPIRDALWRDQAGLCGYCCGRIKAVGHADQPPPGNGGMRIEHITSRHDAPRRMYEWENLLGVCGGLSGAPGGTLDPHCDRTKGERPLTIDPTRRAPDPLTVFTYRRCPQTGGLLIEPVPGAEAHTADIELLALNNPALAHRRREAENAVARRLKGTTGPERRRLLDRTLRAASVPDSAGRLPEFAPVVVRYVTRKLSSDG